MKTVLTEAEHLQLIALMTCARQKADEAAKFERAVSVLLDCESESVGDIDHISDFIWHNFDSLNFAEAIRRAGITVPNPED
jgi:hypothetical protein